MVNPPSRTAKEQTRHNQTISSVAKHYSAKGWAVKADHIEWPCRPELINGHIPDLIITRTQTRRAFRGQSVTTETEIVEVETEGTANDPHALAQDAAFLKAEKENDDITYRRIVI